jgi:hypothetical protein
LRLRLRLRLGFGRRFGLELRSKRLRLGFGPELRSKRLRLGFGLELRSKRLRQEFGPKLRSKRLRLGFGLEPRSKLGLKLGLESRPAKGGSEVLSPHFFHERSAWMRATNQIVRAAWRDARKSGRRRIAAAPVGKRPPSLKNMRHGRFMVARLRSAALMAPPRWHEAVRVRSWRRQASQALA